MKIPFIDLKAQYESIEDEINVAIRQVLDSCAFAGGPFVEKFEEAFAEYCRCDYCIGVGSGTEALWLSLMAYDIGPGDEVVTVPNTFVATAEAISFCGATPVFVDVDEKTLTMNTALLEEVLTPRTKAILPVHLFGQTADMKPILKIAEKHGLVVVEDACQAHGAEYEGKRAGSLGDAGCFSFYPGKNLGAYGEAGAVVTNNAETAKKIRILRDHGQPRKYHHDIVGYNARMDGIQGAVLGVKLAYLEEWNEKRREIAASYDYYLKDAENISLPEEKSYARHVYHVYAIRTPFRDELMSELSQKGISCGIHYPVPVHLTGAYRGLGYGKGSFPIGEQAAEHLLSLPMYPELGTEMVEHICLQIKEHNERQYVFLRT